MIWSMDWSMYQWIYGWIDQCIDWWIDWLIDRWIDRSMDRSIEWSMDIWIYGWTNGLMDGLMDQSNDLWIDGSMDWWTVHRHPHTIFFDPPPVHHWLYQKQYLPSSKGCCQRGLSLLWIRIGCPTGILVFFGTEEFVRKGGRRQPSRADRNNNLMQM